MAGQKERERVFVENGSKLLEKMIGTCNGKSTPIRNFSFKDLKRATDNFDGCHVIKEDLSKWYKGSLEGRNVLIRTTDGRNSNYRSDFLINDIAISAMMSAHNNVLRLIGCCLENQLPSIVFEFAANGTLADRIHHVSDRRTERQYEPMAWSSRLRIVREIAHSISYLHTAFSTPIIHRDIKMTNIFLDQDDVAKLSNFDIAILIPQGETHIIVDTSSGSNVVYTSPEYLFEGKATEKVDVYSFGVLLFELLTGERSFDLARVANNKEVMLLDYVRKRRGHCINEIVDPTIMQGKGGTCIEHQLQAVLDLAFTCTENESGMRPTMVDVTKQLRRIERSIP